MFKLTEQADSDMAAIFLYSLEEFGLDQAEAYSDSLERAYQRLSEFPKLGRLCPELQPDLRRHDVLHHAIYYREIDLDILIIRILHQQMDAEARLISQ